METFLPTKCFCGEIVINIEERGTSWFVIEIRLLDE